MRFLFGFMLLVISASSLLATPKLDWLEENLTDCSLLCKKVGRKGFFSPNDDIAARDLEKKHVKFGKLKAAYCDLDDEDFNVAQSSQYYSELVIIAEFLINGLENCGDPLFRTKEDLDSAWRDVIESKFFHHAYGAPVITGDHSFYIHKSLRYKSEREERVRIISNFCSGKTIPDHTQRPMEVHHVNQMQYGALILMTVNHQRLAAALHVTSMMGGEERLIKVGRNLHYLSISGGSAINRKAFRSIRMAGLTRHGIESYCKASPATKRGVEQVIGGSPNGGENPSTFRKLNLGGVENSNLFNNKRGCFKDIRNTIASQNN